MSHIRVGDPRAQNLKLDHYPNGVTVDSSGNIVWTLDPADNIIVTATEERELHVALFEWTYSGRAKSGKHEVTLLLENLVKVT